MNSNFLIEDAVLTEKFKMLEKTLRSYGGAAVAFSAGVDSTFLLACAHRVLGERSLAVTARSHTVPQREIEQAKRFCQENSIRHIVIDLDELKIPGFADNPPNRCYLCKTLLMKNVTEVAAAQGLPVVCEASNTDDTGDYRPGMRAVKEQGVKSPLMDCGFSKADIRAVSKLMGLPTWDKPSFACLSSRFVYGERITVQKLMAVELAEQKLFDLGFKNFRVRVHSDLARIEVDAVDIQRFGDECLRDEIYRALKNLGFRYITLDLNGYKMGSMNDSLPLTDEFSG